MNRNTNNLTEGVIWKKLLIYFLPIVAGTLFQQFYNAVDAIVVGKFVGTEALAAVGGSASHMATLSVNLFVALSSGATVIIAQEFGAKNEAEVRASVHTAISFSIAIGIALSLIMYPLCPACLKALKTPEDTMADSITYTRIYFAGIVFMLVFNMAAGILRAMGDSRFPLYALLLSCGLNIAMDLGFVIKLQMGVAGVALATVIAQGVSAIMLIVKLCRAKDCSRLRLKELGINGGLLVRMMRIGVPACLQSAAYGVSNMLVQSAINTLGTTIVASWAMSGKIDGTFWAIMGAAGTAVTNFVGQNYGAEKYDRVRGCVKVSFKVFMTVSVFMSFLLVVASRPVLCLFTDDMSVVEMTRTIILYFVPYYFLWTIIELISSTLRGIGDAVIPVIISAVCICAVRIIWIYTVFAAIPTLFALSMSYPLSWLLTDIFLLIYYFKGSKIRQIKAPRGQD